MPWSLTPKRRNAPELMDAPGLPEDEVAEAYRILRRVNRHLGNLKSVSRELDRLIVEDGPWRREEAVTVLDVGSGSGDIPLAMVEKLAARSGGGSVFALDHDATAVVLAGRSGVEVVRGDAMRLPFADAAIDLVTAVKFAHHFTGPPLSRLVVEMARVARKRVLVLDIRRHWVAYYGFVLWSRIFTRNKLVRYDGSLSVLRGFTKRELLELGKTIADYDWTVRAYAGFQLALVGRRIDTSFSRTESERSAETEDQVIRRSNRR